jgi:hypothetical protein
MKAWELQASILAVNNSQQFHSLAALLFTPNPL